MNKEALGSTGKILKHCFLVIDVEVIGK